MIGYIKGTIISQQDSEVIVDVNGVGYRVNLVSGHNINDDIIELFIHTSVSENDISLWGFTSQAELALFRMLLSVSGIGSRTAQSMISSLGSKDIVRGITLEEPALLKAPGVGKKTAERVILELKAKVDQLDIIGEVNVKDDKYKELIDDAVAAVQALGYAKPEIMQIVNQLKASEYSSTQDLIKEILKHV